MRAAVGVRRHKSFGQARKRSEAMLKGHCNIDPLASAREA